MADRCSGKLFDPRCAVLLADMASGAMAPDMIPTMIEQGYRAICVCFDLWGFAGLIKGGLDKAKEYAQDAN